MRKVAQVIAAILIGCGVVTLSYAEEAADGVSSASSSAQSSRSSIRKLLVELQGKSPEVIFKRAERELNYQNRESALELYNALNSLYPFSVYTEQALLKITQLYYDMDNLEKAIEAANKFIRLYPTSAYLEKICYLRAQAYFYSNYPFSWLSEKLRDKIVDCSQRDVEHLTQAQQMLSEFLKRFPNGTYCTEVKQRLEDIHRLLLKHELHIIRFYSKRKAYLSVYNRSIEFIKQYPNSLEAVEVQSLCEEARNQLNIP